MAKKSTTKKKSTKTTNGEKKSNSGHFKPGNTIGYETRIKPGQVLHTVYDEHFPDSLIMYFLECKNVPTFEGWAVSAGVNIKTATAWLSDEKHALFRAAYEQTRAIQKDKIINGGLLGLYDSSMAKFVLSTNHGMKDKTATDSTVKVVVEYSDEIEDESN